MLKYLVQFYGQFSVEEITTDSLELVECIVSSGANVLVEDQELKLWRDGCGRKWTTKWAPIDEPAELCP
jgi:hypothetical protein